MSALIYRRAFTDAHGLRTFAAGHVPDLGSVRRRIFVTERRSGPDRPDHFYKNYLEARLGTVGTVSGLPWSVLSALAERFVERRGGSLRIRADTFEDWRQTLPMISPLAVIVTYLVREGGPPPTVDPRPFLSRELGDSALLAPANALLEAIIERDGLNEMHMHLNGSTEADILWADAVRFPREYHEELLASQIKHGALTAELYDQVEVGLSPYEIYRRLRAARRVRHAMAEQLRRQRQGRSPNLTIAGLLKLMNVDLDDREASFEPRESPSAVPATTIWEGPATTALVDEAGWLFESLRAMATPGPLTEIMGLGLYFNLLVHTLIGRISTQQVDEVGFDQFQKYTVIGVRERLERVYEKRFSQLNVARPHRVLTHLEGRLAPKNSVAELAQLINSIAQGWLRFRDCPRRVAAQGLRGQAPACMTGACGQNGCSHENASGRPDAELSLVIHFIKRKIQTAPHIARECLDGGLRADLVRQAAVVRAVIQRHPFAAQIVRGIDAAANELHAAPEAFGATYRFLRRANDLYATYHVGEDFTHLISGIRAAFEVLTFLKFGMGDRLGHATALGISPGLWLARMGERMILTCGEHLDNAVFAHATLGRAGGGHEATRNRLEGVIARRSAEVYGQEYSPQLLHQAWHLRGLDILELIGLERESDLEPGDAATTATAALKRSAGVASADRQAELNLIAQAAAEHPLAFGLFRLRHRRGESSNALIEIQTDELNADDLSALQESVLRDGNEAGVVLEALPTSNVRIAAYRDLSEHHMFRWLGLTGEMLKNRPTVCVGSDDTGIFATSLRNEYAAIFGILTRNYAKTPAEAAEILHRLNQTGFAFRFRPLREAPQRRL